MVSIRWYLGSLKGQLGGAGRARIRDCRLGGFGGPGLYIQS